MGKKVSIGVAGLGFGREFAAIYRDHPDVEHVAICTRSEATLHEVGDALGIPRDLRFTSYDAMVDCPALDAIHVITPIAEHYPQTMRAFAAGKHVACTVPMATTVDECRAIVRASREAGKYYMMMETALYTREYLHVKALRDRGELGRIQFIRGDHMQNMALEGWGGYWLGFPPFLYGTHVLSPIFDLAGSTAETVRCLGSGRLSEDKAACYGSPFAVETATFTLSGSDVVAEAHRCLFETVRQVRESFDIYGSKMSFEWETTLDEGHTLFHGIDEFTKVHAPETERLLPESIRKYTRREAIKDPNQPSFIQGAGHGGSHPHLCHEFVRALVEDRQPYVNALYSASITCAGIMAHESALRGGELLTVPDLYEEFH